MPQKPRRPCRYPGCPGFCEQGQVFCKDHMEWSSDRLRGGADARGYEQPLALRPAALFLKQHPLCAICQARASCARNGG
jgi:5-methylcytosine-specific restriction protein A